MFGGLSAIRCACFVLFALACSVATANPHTYVPGHRCYNSPDAYAKPFPDFGNSPVCYWKKVELDTRPPNSDLEVEKGVFSGDETIDSVARQSVQSVTLSYDGTTTYQTIDGIGASIVYFGNWITFHPNKGEIFDLLFTELKPSVLRIRNHYNSENEFQNSEELMSTDEEIVKAAQARLGNSIEVMMSSWSPPAELKKNEALKQGADKTQNTLKKWAGGWFYYNRFAKHWADSLSAYSARGIVPKWISPQNEPDFSTENFESCLFGEEESSDYPSYFTAFIRVARRMWWLNIDTTVIGPESSGYDSFLEDSSVGTWMQTVANHLYKAGDNYKEPGFYTNLESHLRNGRAAAEARGVSKIYMTEFANLVPHELEDPLDFARVVHMTLTLGNAAMYLNWDLMWGAGFDEGSLTLVENPFDTASWTTTAGYYTTGTFWWFSHFSRYIRPGSVRVECSLTGDTDDVLSLCFKGDGASFVVIVMNLSESEVSLDLQGLPSGATQTETSNLESNSRTIVSPIVDATARELAPKSIMTIYTV